MLAFFFQDIYHFVGQLSGRLDALAYHVHPLSKYSIKQISHKNKNAFLHFEFRICIIAPFCIGVKLIMMPSTFKQVGIRQNWSTSNNPLACTEGAYYCFKMSLSWKCPDHYQFDIWKSCFYRTFNLSY